MKLSDLIPNPNNPRNISQEKLDKLAASITKFEKMMALRPIIIDENNVILGGNMRYKALKSLGYDILPEDWVKKVTDLSDEEKRQFIIKDNVGFGEWDWELLAVEWDKEELEKWGLEVQFEVEEEKEASDDNYEIPDNIEVDVKPGDLIEIGEHKLLCASSTEVDTWERLMGDQLADLVITDPPYNVDYTGGTGLKIQNDKMENSDFYNFLYDFYTALGAYTKAGGSWYVWFADVEIVNFSKSFIDSGFKLAQMLIWKKSSLVLGRKDYHFIHEPCLYGWKEGAGHSWYGDRKQTTIMNFDKPARNSEHPTMKPVELIAYQMGNSSKTGDLVCDGFLGSGTTMVAAHQLGRRCYGMELDEKYCQVIIDRMIKLDGDIVVKINGETYEKGKS